MGFNKEILRLAVPNIISNVSVPMLSTVDTALMGRLSESHIGAVGLGAMVFNLVYWNFGFLRMGTTGLVAQAYGKESNAGIINTFTRALLVGFVLACLILLLQYPLGWLGFKVMNVAESQEALVAEYFYIRIWAAPATLLLYAFLGYFFGMQNAIYPLILTICINVINILLSFWFVHYWNWEVAGVAWSTVIAQYCGLFLAIGLFLWKYTHLLEAFQQKALLEWEAFQSFLQVNSDILIRTFLLTFSFAFFYSQSSSQGELILAGNVILLQFLNWTSYGIDGFAFASESLVGKYSGKEDVKATYRVIWLSFGWGLALAVGYSLVFGIWGTDLLWLFTDQAEVVAAAQPFLFWMILFPVLSCFCYIWDGIFIGLTASVAMRNSMLLAFTFYMILYYTWGITWANNGLWASLLLFMLARALFQTGWFWVQGEALR